MAEPAKPPKKVPPPMPMSSAEVAARMPEFTVGELVDLALCSPEIGAVNFNILRLLLRDVIDKTGIDKTPVKMNDLEAHQVENFKHYVQGASIASPMPGVLKINNNNQGPGGGMVYNVKSSPGVPGGVAGSDGKQPSKLSPPGPQQIRKTGPHTHPPLFGGPQESGGNGTMNELADKVARLERHLEALYQLPANQEILEKTKGEGMSVTDMWQIIQLNNRIAAVEAAIQKMASLIEDLAKNVNRVKGDAKNAKKGADDLTLTSSDLQLQGAALSEKCGKFGDIVEGLRDELDKIKKGWKHDRDLLEKALGVDLGKVPSFMKPSPPSNKRAPDREIGEGAEESPSEQFERGTQTFIHLKDKEKKHDKPAVKTVSGGQQMESQKRGPAEQQQKRPSQEQPQSAQKQPQQPGKPQQPPPGTPQQAPGNAASPAPKTKRPSQQIPAEQIAQMTPEEIAASITPEEVAKITPEIYEKMTPDQKKAVKKARGPVAPKKPKPQMGVKDMTPDDVAEIDPNTIEEQMPYDEAVNIPPDVLAQMDEKQRAAVNNVVKSGPKKKIQPTRAPKPSMGIAEIPQDQLQNVSPDTIAKKMSYDEAAAIPTEVFNNMTPEQRDAIKKIIAAGSSPIPIISMDDDDEDDDDDFFLSQQVPEPMQETQAPNTAITESKAKRPSKEKPKKLSAGQITNIAALHPEDMVKQLTPEMAQGIPEEELQRQFTPDQINEIQKIAAQKPKRSSEDRDKEHTINLNTISTENMQNIPPSDLVSNLTPHQLLDLTSEQIDKMTQEQKAAVMKARRKTIEQNQNEDDVDDEHDETPGSGKKAGQERQKPTPKLRGKDKHPHHHHSHHHKPHDQSSPDVPHPQVNILQGPIPTVGEPLPPMTLERYLATLPAEEAANLAADAVQREMQKQYAQLQGMQRQLAQDIQQKMEFIYQKLLKEIAVQQLTTSPYMALGSQETCLGPGVCTGHGMPAGIAVCQFTDAKDNDQRPVSASPATGITPGVAPDGSVCPGPGVCPATEVCPHCQGKGQGQQQAVLQALRTPEKRIGSVSAPKGYQMPELDESILREMKSLMLLDLEKIRDDMRAKKFGVFDEQDIVERLGAVWEALKILKHNEEALAVKISRQDAMIKKIPVKAIEKINMIPEENIEAISTGQFQKPMFIPDGVSSKQSLHKELEEFAKLRNIGSAVDKEDIQTLFNNLANVIAECAEHKDRIDQLGDVTRIMESGMVTKQMLLDALSDKADKGLINTKVSYDEFGNTVDELHNQLHNLMVEGYQRHENWKKVTTDLADELSVKLDKIELAPIRAFFKTNLKELEEKVKTLSNLIEEPDPAGTRKRLLKDYNCLSCDRMVNISGVTNGPTLPTIGPILANHPTVSRRALDLHRMRMKKQFDPNNKNLNAMERQNRPQTSRPLSKGVPDANQIANDVDVNHIVNRYTGGSHTTVTTGDRISSARKPSTGANAIVNPAISGGGSNVAAPITATTTGEDKST